MDNKKENIKRSKRNYYHRVQKQKRKVVSTLQFQPAQVSVEASAKQPLAWFSKPAYNRSKNNAFALAAVFNALQPKLAQIANQQRQLPLSSQAPPSTVTPSSMSLSISSLTPQATSPLNLVHSAPKSLQPEVIHVSSPTVVSTPLATVQSPTTTALPKPFSRSFIDEAQKEVLPPRTTTSTTSAPSSSLNNSSLHVPSSQIDPSAMESVLSSIGPKYSLEEFIAVANEQAKTGPVAIVTQFGWTFLQAPRVRQLLGGSRQDSAATPLLEAPTSKLD